MATAVSRHRSDRAPQPRKILPIDVPSKTPNYTSPVSRVARSPPELSETSTVYSGGRHSAGSYSVYSSRHSDSGSSGHYDPYNAAAGVDVVDMLSDRMNTVFDPIRMDKSLAMQAQTSGQLNASQRELAELQALAQRRVKAARVNFAEGVQAAREARRDLDYTTQKVASMKARVAQKHPDAYAKAKRNRHVVE